MARRPVNVQQAIQFFTGFFVGTFPAFILPIALSNLYRLRSEPGRYWQKVWFLTISPICLSILLGQRMDELLPVLLFVVVSLLATGTLWMEKRVGSLAFTAVLLFTIIVGTIQFWFGIQTWRDPSGSVAPNNWWTGQVQLVAKTNQFFKRSWFVQPEATSPVLRFEAREATSPSLNWVASSAGIDIKSNSDITKISVTQVRDPFVQQVFFTGAPLAGRRFRVALDFRANKSFPAFGCRGIWLQESGGNYAGVCQSVRLGPNWKRFELTWLAPNSIHSPASLQVVLNDFDGITFEVRNLELEERIADRWVSLLQPWVQLGQGVGRASNRVYLKQSDQWQSYQVTSGKSEQLQAMAYLAGAGFELRGIQLENAPINWLRTIQKNNQRYAMWFEHPNLAGHAILAIGLCAMLLTTRFCSRLGLFFLALVALWFTGSRGAWFGYQVAGILLLVWCATDWYQRSALAIVVSVLVLTGVFVSGRTISIPSFEDGNPVSRTMIWEGAIQALMEHPIGLGEHGFKPWFERKHPGFNGQVEHAHNFWLEMAVRYGWLGVFSGMTLTISLVLWSWRVGGWDAIFVVLGVLIANVFDYSLLFPNVALTLYVALNSMWLAGQERSGEYQNRFGA
jgi:hypothetical protein